MSAPPDRQAKMSASLTLARLLRRGNMLVASWEARQQVVTCRDHMGQFE